MAGPDDPDFDMTVEAAVEAPAKYRLTFGSLLRGGAVYQEPAGLERDITGRVAGGVATVEGGESHRWRGDGPISLFNNGRGAITISINGSPAVRIPAGGAFNTACPTAKKRNAALGFVAGGVVGAVLGALDGGE